MDPVSNTEDILGLKEVCETDLLVNSFIDVPLKTCALERAFTLTAVSVCGLKADDKPPIAVYGSKRVMNQRLVNFPVSHVIRLLQIKVALQRQGRVVVVEIPRSNRANLPTFDLISNITMDGVTFSISQHDEIDTALGIPQIATLNYMRPDKTSKLLREVINGTDGVVWDGMTSTCRLSLATAPVTMTTAEADRTADLSFGDWFSIRCSWSDLGNFLLARKNHGDEVALATLHCIVSKT